jgi:hypothetical protein
MLPVNLLVALEILTAVVMKSSNFWDITTHSPLKVNRSFGGTYCLRLEGRRISEARSQTDVSSCYLLHAALLLP